MTATRINGIKANLETLTLEEIQNNIVYADERVSRALDDLYALNTELVKREVELTIESEV